MAQRSYDPDEEFGAETWAESEYRRRRDEAIDPPVGVGPATGAHERTEHHPNRMASWDEIYKRVEARRQREARGEYD